jgi:hypothetical protein
MNSKQVAAEIRKSFKSSNIKASVRIDGSSTVLCEVNSGSLKAAREIAVAFEKIQRDADGNVVGGRNMFVHVVPGAELIRDFNNRVRSALFQVRLARTAPGTVPVTGCCIDGKRVEILNLTASPFGTVELYVGEGGQELSPDTIRSYHNEDAAIARAAWVLAENS